jgi:hypothetical protein
MVNTCSAMCDSGRYERVQSSASNLWILPTHSMVHTQLPWLSITALGGPVVPEV